MNQRTLIYNKTESDYDSNTSISDYDPGSDSSVWNKAFGLETWPTHFRRTKKQQIFGQDDSQWPLKTILTHRSFFSLHYKSILLYPFLKKITIMPFVQCWYEWRNSIVLRALLIIIGVLPAFRSSVIISSSPRV